MKNNVFRFVLFAVIVITVFSILFVILDKDYQERLSETTNLSDEYYTISEYKGKIAVFRSGENIPIDIFDVYVSTLPQHDKTLIQQGIEIKTPEELQKIIEDYTS